MLTIASTMFVKDPSISRERNRETEPGMAVEVKAMRRRPCRAPFATRDAEGTPAPVMVTALPSAEANSHCGQAVRTSHPHAASRPHTSSRPHLAEAFTFSVLALTVSEAWSGVSGADPLEDF